MKYLFPFLIILLPFSVIETRAQQTDFSDVRLFQSFFQDARITQKAYVGGNLFFGDFDFVNTFSMEARGGYTFNPNIEAEGTLGFLNVDPRFGESRTGFQDIFLTGRYLFDLDNVQLAAGSSFTLPVGKESIGEENFDIGFYGATRYLLNDRFVLTGNLQLNFLKIGDDRESSLGVGLGTIYRAGNRLHLIGELLLESETDFAAFSPGVDYKIKNVGHIRAALIAGADDGAPDIGVTGGFIYPF